MLGFSPLASTTLADDRFLLNASVTGVSSTASVGSIVITGDSTLTLTGVSSTASVGSVSVVGDSTLTLTGVSSTASVETTFFWNPVEPPKTNTWTEIAA